MVNFFIIFFKIFLHVILMYVTTVHKLFQWKCKTIIYKFFDQIFQQVEAVSRLGYTEHCRVEIQYGAEPGIGLIIKAIATLVLIDFPSVSASSP